MTLSPQSFPAPSSSAIQSPHGRSAEIQSLLHDLEPLLLAFVDQADAPNDLQSDNHHPPFHSISPAHLLSSFHLDLPHQGQGNAGVVTLVDALLKSSTNTWHQGFMSKLYASTNAIGVASELILAFLNTNVHTYSVSPALSAVEKSVAKALARLFGFDAPTSGGIVQPGGSGANLTALVTARNNVVPLTKSDGVRGSKRLVLFTSEHGHYSFEKAANICGLGSTAVIPVKVDATGRMSPQDLRAQIAAAKARDELPFFVNATAGTTVLGSYDPLQEIGEICAREGLWFHVDASWGGPAIFSPEHKNKLAGSHLADSLTVNPHKMMGVPVTCSFLLGKDLGRFWKSSTLPAPYLFHSSGAGSDGDDCGSVEDVWDLADLTLQCGRKGDALKLALGWQYYGFEGYRARIEGAFAVAGQLAGLISQSQHLTLVSENPPPCLQVCFYVSPGGLDVSKEPAEENSQRTQQIAKRLLEHDFHVDYAPGAHGLFLRAVCSLQTMTATVQKLVTRVEQLGLRL